LSAALNTLITAADRCIEAHGSERIMTVLGAVVFGGFLVLGVLWLLVTAPASDVDEAAWGQSQWPEHANSASAGELSGSWALSHSSQN
jgi:hypothetical protein